MALSIEWAIIVLVFIFIIFLIYKILKKLEKKSFYAVTCVCVTVFLSISMFIGMTIASIDTVYSYLIGDSYDAVIVNVHPSRESVSYSGSKSTLSHKKTVIMYQAVFEFTDKKGVKQIKESSMLSGEKPEVGAVRSINYFDGDSHVHENSYQGYALDLICLYFAVVTGVTSIGIIYYAFNRPIQIYVKLFIQLIILAILCLLGQMWFFLTSFSYDAMIGKRDEPLSSIILCVFFAVVLFLFLLGILIAVIKRVFKRQ